MSISILHQASLSSDDLEELKGALALIDPDTDVSESEDHGPQNALEWALPVAIALICSAPITKLIEGFFGAAGEDAYKALKSATSKVFSKAKSKAPSWSKLDGTPVAPPPMSVSFPVGYGSVKFVFPQNLAEADVPGALEKMNATLAHVTSTLAWYDAQFQLQRDHYIELYGPGFPIEDQHMAQLELASQLALGTWVFIAEAKSWVKAH